MSRAMRKHVLCHMRTTTAHPHSLISAFVVHCLDSVMSLVSVTKISSLMLASVAEQASLSLTWSETPEDTFSHDKAQIFMYADFTLRKHIQLCSRNKFHFSDHHHSMNAMGLVQSKVQGYNMNFGGTHLNSFFECLLCRLCKYVFACSLI